MVAGTHGIPFAVGPAAGIDDMEDRIRLPEVIEKLVAEALALVGVGNKPGDIDQVHGNEPAAVNAVAASDV